MSLNVNSPYDHVPSTEESAYQEMLTSCFAPFNIVRNWREVPNPQQGGVDGVLYYVDESLEDQRTDEAWASLIMQARMEILHAQAGGRTASALSQVMMKSSSAVDRDEIHKRGLNYVGRLAGQGNCIWGNQTHQGHNIAELQVFAMLIKAIVFVWNRHHMEPLGAPTCYSIDSLLSVFADKIHRDFHRKIIWNWQQFNTLVCQLACPYSRNDGQLYVVSVNMEKPQNIMTIEPAVKKTLLDVYGPDLFLDVFE